MASVTRVVRMSMSAAVLAALAITEDASLAIETTPGVAGLKLSLSIRKKATTPSGSGQNLNNAPLDAQLHIASLLPVDALGCLAGVNNAFHELLQDKVDELKPDPEIYFNKNEPNHVLIPVAANQTVGSRGHYLLYFKNSKVKDEDGGSLVKTVRRTIRHMLHWPHSTVVSISALPSGFGYELIGSKNIVDDLNKLGFQYATDLVEVATARYLRRAKYALSICKKNRRSTKDDPRIMYYTNSRARQKTILELTALVDESKAQ